MSAEGKAFQKQYSVPPKTGVWFVSRPVWLGEVDVCGVPGSIAFPLLRTVTRPSSVDGASPCPSSWFQDGHVTVADQ